MCFAALKSDSRLTQYTNRRSTCFATYAGTEEEDRHAFFSPDDRRIVCPGDSSLIEYRTMPELPDLLYIKNHLAPVLPGRTVRDAVVKQPIIIRNTLPVGFESALAGKTVNAIDVRAPFIRFAFSDHIDLILNLMLAGRIQLQSSGEKAIGYICFSLLLDDKASVNVGDEQKMAKAYLVREGQYEAIPKYNHLGIDIRSPEFTFDEFARLAGANRRKQVRVFINDHTIFSAIGNAYADEILFEARIHPKTFVAKLSSDELTSLYAAIQSVMEWGIRKVEEARQPIHVKVRDHLKVRNRKDEPCPRCGTTIRREGVRGYDVFFCPHCQPASRQHFINWQ